MSPNEPIINEVLAQIARAVAASLGIEEVYVNEAIEEANQNQNYNDTI